MTELTACFLQFLSAIYTEAGSSQLLCQYSWHNNRFGYFRIVYDSNKQYHRNRKDL